MAIENNISLQSKSRKLYFLLYGIPVEDATLKEEKNEPINLIELDAEDSLGIKVGGF